MSYIAKVVLSEEVVDGVCIDVYNPGHGIKIDRANVKSFEPIVAKLPNGIRHLYMPSPIKCNALTVEAKDFRRSQDVLGIKPIIKVHDGVYADGSYVPKGSAFAITSADCPTIVMWGKNSCGVTKVCAAHAGRDSLIERSALHNLGGNGSQRAHFSVVDAARSLILNHGVVAKTLCLKIYCGIRSGFTHQQTGGKHETYNRNLINHCSQYGGAVVTDIDTGEIDLYQLIRSQAIESGILARNIKFDEADTWADDRWASNRRNPGSDERNLVIVSHKSAS